jgi:transposase
VARIKADYNSPYSITKVATLFRISALERTDSHIFLTQQDHSITSNQNVKELSLFDDIKKQHDFIAPVVMLERKMMLVPYLSQFPIPHTSLIRKRTI